MDEKKAALQDNAPLIDFDELRNIVLEEMLTPETRTKAHSVWISGNFSDPTYDIATEDSPSSLDLFVLIPDWTLPPADCGIPIMAPEVEMPPAYQNFDDAWESKGTETDRWDCSPQEAWNRLPNHAQETLKNSAKKGFYASEADVEDGLMRGYELSIGNEKHFQHGRRPRSDICLEGDEKSVN